MKGVSIFHGISVELRGQLSGVCSFLPLGAPEIIRLMCQVLFTAEPSHKQFIWQDLERPMSMSGENLQTGLTRGLITERERPSLAVDSTTQQVGMKKRKMTASMWRHRSWGGGGGDLWLLPSPLESWLQLRWSLSLTSDFSHQHLSGRLHWPPEASIFSASLGYRQPLLDFTASTCVRVPS